MDAPRRIKIRNGYINEPMPYATGGGETLSYILDTPEALAKSGTVRALVKAAVEAEVARLEAILADLVFAGRTLQGWTQHDVIVNSEGAYRAITTIADRLAALLPVARDGMEG